MIPPILIQFHRVHSLLFFLNVCNSFFQAVRNLATIVFNILTHLINQPVKQISYTFTPFTLWRLSPHRTWTPAHPDCVRVPSAPCFDLLSHTKPFLLGSSIYPSQALITHMRSPSVEVSSHQATDTLLTPLML